MGVFEYSLFQFLACSLNIFCTQSHAAVHLMDFFSFFLFFNCSEKQIRHGSLKTIVLKVKADNRTESILQASAHTMNDKIEHIVCSTCTSLSFRS